MGSASGMHRLCHAVSRLELANRCPYLEVMKPSSELFAREWIEAWNSHELERILEHYADDIRFTSPFIVKLTGRADGTILGKAGLRDYFARALQAYPDLRFDRPKVYAGVNSVVLTYESVKGLLAAETMEFGQDGKVIRVMAHYFDPDK
jgi:hypothetical protein